MIITIIVMVILAGIIIVSAVADGGIIDRAQTALIEQEKAEAQDIIETSYVYKTTASQTTYGYLDMPETAKAIYANLTDAGFKLKKSDGTEAKEVKDIYSVGDTLELNIKGKRSEYKGTVKEKMGLEKDLEEVIGGGKDPDPIPPVPPEYSNEAVWKTDGNGTIIEYLGTEQSVEIQRIEAEFDDGNVMVEVQKIFGDKQQLVEQWVEDYRKYIELNIEMEEQGESFWNNIAPTLFAMMTGGTYDSTYEEYKSAINDYLGSGENRPNNLPETLEKELTKYEETMIIMDFGTPEEIKEIKALKYQDNLTIPSVYKGETIKTIGDGTENSRLSYTLSVEANVKNLIIEEGIEKINANALQSYTLETVSLPSTLKTIESKAFYGSKLKQIDGLEYVTEKLGEYCFSGTTQLNQEITVNSKLIEANAFSSSGISSLEIGPNVESLGKASFSSADIKSITFSNDGNLKTIGDNCFAYSDISSVVVPDGLEYIGRNCFSSCESLQTVSTSYLSVQMFLECKSLTSVNITSNVTEIPNSSFQSCESLKNIILPDSVERFGQLAFSDTGLVEFTIPKSLTQITDHCFYGCEQLTQITIPESVSTIGKNAFLYCSNLTVDVSFGSESQRPEGWDKSWADGVKQVNYAQ